MNNQAVYFSHRRRPVETRLTLTVRNIPFVNHTKYLGVTSYRKITWRLHISPPRHSECFFMCARSSKLSD